MSSLLAQAGKFGVVGLLNTVVGLGTILLCQVVFGFSEVAANAIGYAVGLLLSFWLNRGWTFDSPAGLSAFGRFVLAFFAAYLANISVVLWLIRSTLVPSTVAQVAGVVPYALVFFLLSRFFVFAGPRARYKT